MGLTPASTYSPGQAGGDRPTEQHRGPGCRNTLTATVPALEPVGELQRRQGEGDERGDPVAHGQPEWRLRSDLGDGADEHAARARHGVLHLAAGGDDVEDLRAHGVPVARVLLAQLAKGCRVEVERLDVDADLVGPQVAAGVQDTGRLRKGSAGGVDDPVHAHGGRRGGAHKNLLIGQHAAAAFTVKRDFDGIHCVSCHA